jgi:hypothetical protein
LFEYLRNLFERSSFFQEDYLGGRGFRRGDTEKPVENENKKEKEKPQ